jgi:hypothetical protein
MMGVFSISAPVFGMHNSELCLQIILAELTKADYCYCIFERLGRWPEPFLSGLRLDLDTCRENDFIF